MTGQRFIGPRLARGGLNDRRIETVLGVRSGCRASIVCQTFLDTKALRKIGATIHQARGPVHSLTDRSVSKGGYTVVAKHQIGCLSPERQELLDTFLAELSELIEMGSSSLVEVQNYSKDILSAFTKSDECQSFDEWLLYPNWQDYWQMHEGIAWGRFGKEQCKPSANESEVERELRLNNNLILNSAITVFRTMVQLVVADTPRLITQATDQLREALEDYLHRLGVRDQKTQIVKRHSNPVWRPEERKLYFQGKVARQVANQAKNVARVFDAFQENDWKRKIPDPINSFPTPDKVAWTVESMNKGLLYIKFSQDVTVNGYRWDLLDQEDENSV